MPNCGNCDTTWTFSDGDPDPYTCPFCRFDPSLGRFNPPSSPYLTAIIELWVNGQRVFTVKDIINWQITKSRKKVVYWKMTVSANISRELERLENEGLLWRQRSRHDRWVYSVLAFEDLTRLAEEAGLELNHIPTASPIGISSQSPP